MLKIANYGKAWKSSRNLYKKVDAFLHDLKVYDSSERSKQVAIGGATIGGATVSGIALHVGLKIMAFNLSPVLSIVAPLAAAALGGYYMYQTGGNKTTGIVQWLQIARVIVKAALKAVEVIHLQLSVSIKEKRFALFCERTIPNLQFLDQVCKEGWLKLL